MHYYIIIVIIVIIIVIISEETSVSGKDQVGNIDCSLPSEGTMLRKETERASQRSR